MDIIIRAEQASDIGKIRLLTKAAFKNVEYSTHNEHFIVDALRKCSRLSLSLVAVHEQAISPVQLSSKDEGWYGLGPISVQPDLQRRGIGRLLMQDVLKQLKQQSAAGCVLLGAPHYYQQFGFQPQPQLTLADVPAEYFQALSFDGYFPQAEVFYDAAFYVTAE